jgi:NADPH2:quinone reductase
MQAIQVEKYGEPDQLILAETALPEAGPDDALVKISYAGVNYIDVYMRDGTYASSHTYRTPLPMTLGMEGVGRVESVGSEVTDLSPGTRVAYCLERGSYAQYARVPAAKLVPVPDTVPDEIACSLMLQGFTAHYLSHSAYPINAGDTCLVHAGAGGVGQLLIQLAKLRGATVYTTVGSAAKAEIATALGADACILYREQSFAEEIQRLTGGAGVQVVYDSVGQTTLRDSFRCLARRGYCINFGASSGQADPVAPLELAEAGSIFLTRPHLADYVHDRDERRWRAGDLFTAWQSGKLKVSVDKVLPLAAAADAHRVMERRESRGKLLLEVTHED